MRCRCSAGIFQCSAVFNWRTWPLVHLTICSLRIRWSKRITPRIQKTTHTIRCPATKTSRFNELWKRYEKRLEWFFSNRAKLNSLTNIRARECDLAERSFYRLREPERFYTWGNSGLEPYSGSGNQLSRNRRGLPMALQSWRTAMEQYVGLDVSLKLTAICIVDRRGKIEREGVVASDPETIAAFIKSHAPHVARVGLEAGATSTWLWTELNKMGLPVICIDARHAKAALKMQINKSDRNDAVGIARIIQCGWYKEVRVKGLDSHAIKAVLVSRALLVKIKRDIENQIRGLLKNLGLVIGRAKMNMFAARAAELAEARPELAAAVEPLLKAREAVGRQIADLDRKVMRLARSDAQVRRFMTAPGVGPITALCFLATIDDPTRFKRSRSVVAYVGLTTRRYASGEIDWTGRISKCGDKMLRSYLYEAANVLLTRVAKWSTLTDQ